MVPSKFEFDIDPEFPIQITPRAGHLKKGMVGGLVRTIQKRIKVQ